MLKQHTGFKVRSVWLQSYALNPCLLAPLPAPSALNTSVVYLSLFALDILTCFCTWRTASGLNWTGAFWHFSWPDFLIFLLQASPTPHTKFPSWFSFKLCYTSLTSHCNIIIFCLSLSMASDYLTAKFNFLFFFSIAPAYTCFSSMTFSKS